jgi:hypothetical protein
MLKPFYETTTFLDLNYQSKPVRLQIKPIYSTWCSRNGIKEIILLSRLFMKWALRSQLKEINEFIENLKSMDSDEIGLLVAVSAHIKNSYAQDGHYINDPIIYTAQNPLAAVEFGKLIRFMQKQKRPEYAAGVMVWLHTMRAGINLNLRSRARVMWGELERGFKSAPLHVWTINAPDGSRLNIKNYDTFPIGFDPEPK